MLGHDLDLADDLRQLAVTGLIEMERDFVFVGLRQLRDVAIVGGVAWVVLPERLKREDDILDCYRVSIVPLGVGTQPIDGR